MSGEPTGFLYPFIDAEERDADALIADLTASARSKMTESRALRAATVADLGDDLEVAAAALAARFARGGRLWAFGNGGSATDADQAVALFRAPPSGRPLPALSLVADRAVLTALANDVGYDLVFSRQLIAHARADDIALGFSTSGSSDNVLAAFREARHRGVLTVGLAGYDGGSMAASDTLDHCFVVPSESIHRIQEGQDAVILALWQAVQRRLDPVPQP